MSAALRRRLLAHYRACGRDFPWRRTRDPYRIWVSEVMLQQTRTATVEERYGRFLARYPDVERLAAARAEDVCAEWAGLGYYSRARNLHAAARRVRDDHRGRVPAEVAALRELPGIGAYTAAAIASIAYGRRAAALDGNAERVLARVLADARSRRGDPSPRVRAFAAALIECARPGDVNQALMDVGATICTPRAPRCPICPLRPDCKAATGDPQCYPRPRARAAPRELRIAFAWIESSDGVWLERRPLGGLWGGLWELPSACGPRARNALAGRLNVELRDVGVRVRHDLTHRRVTATVFEPAVRVPFRRGDALRPHADPLDAPLSTLARKAIEAYALRRAAVKAHLSRERSPIQSPKRGRMR